MTAIEKLHGALTSLGLKAVDPNLANLLEHPVRSEPSYADFLDQLLGCEVDAVVFALGGPAEIGLAGAEPERLFEFDEFGGRA